LNVRKGADRCKGTCPLKAMKKEWYEKFRWTFSSSGFLIIGGKDSTQNEILVKKHLGQHDIFAHADLPGGSVVIIKSNGKDVPEETKIEAVLFAVSYSRSWRGRLGVADGYWVNSDQVTKTPPSGEYLAKGAFMIYGERNYVRNSPLSLSLGIGLSPEGFKVLVGSEGFVKSASAAYVNLVPAAWRENPLLRLSGDC